MVVIRTDTVLVDSVFPGATTPIDLPVSTLCVLLLLGPLVVLFIVAKLASWNHKPIVGKTAMTGLECASILAGVLFLCYFCENHWPFPKVAKTESVAMYWGTFSVLIIASFFTMRKSTMSDFMHRDQTEEWKGWMQFLFLGYHYWKMESSYNDIRVYITCYLWMTGFGNFSFFYVKEDFSILRVLQMMWRMNFFVFFLCLTMNNPYIVYYICPLHSFFFLVTYATMGLWSSVNRGQYGAGVKLFVCAALLYLVYDGMPKLFEVFFGWLSTQPTGASIGKNGIKFEWYFRSFLDHFSTLWGMIFALNMPFVAEWYKRVENFTASREWFAKLSVLSVVLCMFAVWAAYVYPRKKTDYNALHCYYSIIPLLAYLFLRNISFTARCYYLHLLHLFGQMSLESYLLQYHIWLADNAGMLLNIVPGYPVATYVLASCLHIFCASRIFDITARLREVVVPSDAGVAMTNLAALGVSVVAAYLVAYGFLSYGLGLCHLTAIIVGLAVAGGVSLLYLSDEDEKVAMIGKMMRDSNKWKMICCAIIVISAVALSIMPNCHCAHKSAEVQMKASLIEANVTRQTSCQFSDLYIAPFSSPVSKSSSHAAVKPQSIIEMMEIAETATHKQKSTGQFELGETILQGVYRGFDVGSMAQPWHGLVALVMIAVCLLSGDPFFGLCRVSLFAFGPEGQKTISWDEAYGPLLARLNAARSRTPSATRPSPVHEA